MMINTGTKGKPKWIYAGKVGEKRMRPKIKFSHHYTKMPKDFRQTMLMAVFVIDRSEIGELFEKYDTLIAPDEWEYLCGTLNEKSCFYALPKGKLIVLLLITGANGHVWTTIQRWIPKKEMYYRSLIGHDVDIVIEESS